MYIGSFCTTCSSIKNIMAIYGHKEVADILKKVCIRNKKQQDYKIVEIKKEVVEK
jgi:hypothetical protein